MPDYTNSLVHTKIWSSPKILTWKAILTKAHIYGMLKPCYTMRGCAKQTIFLFVLARNQTKAWARDLRRDRKWGKKGRSERSQGSWKKELREGSWRKETQWSSQQWSAEGSSEDSGWVGIPSSFVEISLEIHASVSLQMHRKCSVI